MALKGSAGMARREDEVVVVSVGRAEERSVRKGSAVSVVRRMVEMRVRFGVRE